jgi:hypothetical protein
VVGGSTGRRRGAVACQIWPDVNAAGGRDPASCGRRPSSDALAHHTDSMTNASPDDWSPADNPYAIAVSQSQMWRDVVRLAVLRMREADGRQVGWFSSQQLDAHVLVMTLRQLLTAEQLEQAALEELGIDPGVGAALAAARMRFEAALPGIKNMRDALMHFDEWARGKGLGPQAMRRKAGDALRDIAREYWRFGYDPAAGTVSFGPYVIDIDVAERAAAELCRAIYAAAHEVDKGNTTELRAKAIEALSGAGIGHNFPGSMLMVSPGNDMRVWLSFGPGNGEPGQRALAEQIVSSLAAARIRLESTMSAETLDSAERLT